MLDASLLEGANQRGSMATWLDLQPVEVPAALAAVAGGHSLVAQTLARRGVLEPAAAAAFLDTRQYTPAPPAELPNLARAADRLETALSTGEKICVWGDFDVDGQTATTLLVSALQSLGGNVIYHIPVRANESHGIQPAVLQSYLVDGIDLLLTCDTGVSAHAAVELATNAGVDVIITDHHNLPQDSAGKNPVLPVAYAIVNPKMLPGEHPLATLPGVGVAYKLVEELFTRRGAPAEEYLDLVALGIVADVALLVGDTRYLLQRGLEVLRRGARLGLRAMLETTGLDPQWLTEEHIGFIIAPRLNALGRLGDANPSVEFFTTQDLGQARLLALELEGLNARRKVLTDQVFQASQGQLDREPELRRAAAIVLADPHWPAGVVGIVASRLVEQYHKPVVLISAPPGELARGSARSIEGIDITAAIAEHQGLLASFGGHPMAAGLAIQPERIPAFRQALSRTVASASRGLPEVAPQQIDGYVELSELTLDFVADLERLAPFGAGNPPLVLASRDLELVSHTAMGRDDEHLLLTVRDLQDVTQRVIWWQGTGWPLPETRFDLAYTVRASTYRGQRDVQVEWVDARPCETGEPIPASGPPEIEIIDHRLANDPASIWQQLAAREELATWCEGLADCAKRGHTRLDLGASPSLAIWTAPPGPDELAQALAVVQPQTVYLFALDAGQDRPPAFLAQLAGLTKHALRAYTGQTSLERLTAATGQRPAAVRFGLEWLQARGHLAVDFLPAGEIRLAAGTGVNSPESEMIAAKLRALLAETAAYRAHFRRSPAEQVLRVT